MNPRTTALWMASIATLATACVDEKLGAAPMCEVNESARQAFIQNHEDVKVPVDVVLLVDNSDSMLDEIESLQANINTRFASLLNSVGFDHRIVVVSQHGNSSTEASVCISSPLSGASCSPVPSRPANTSRFMHFSYQIGSHDGWCKLLLSLDGVVEDDFGMITDGWAPFLRPEALKLMIHITDDGVECTFRTHRFDDNDTVTGGIDAAAEMDMALLETDPQSFGTAAKRNYMWYAISGHDPDASGSVLSSALPIESAISTEALGPGTGTQALAILSGGLRFSVAAPQALELAFENIIQHTVDSMILREQDCSYGAGGN